MITRSRSKQMQQKVADDKLNGMISMGLKYEEVQRVRKQNRCFSWFKFLLSTTAFIAACFASMKVAQSTGTNAMGSIYDFTERSKEYFFTIPYKVPGYSYMFGKDNWATPSMPWIILEGSLTSNHLFYEPNSSIHVALQVKQQQYDNATETIYQVLVQKTNYETIMRDSQHFLSSLPQVRQILSNFATQKRVVSEKKDQLCSTNILGTTSCSLKQHNYDKANEDLEELRTLRSYILDFSQFPNLFFANSKFLQSFPKLNINSTAFQTLLHDREKLLHHSGSSEPQDLFAIASCYTTPKVYFNSTLLQHVLNSLLSPLIDLYSQVLTHLYKKQSNLLSQIGVLQSAYTSTMVEKQYEDAIKEWDGFVSQCYENHTPVCLVGTTSNRIQVVDIVYELRTNALPIPDNFLVLLQRVFLNPDRYANATARDVARVIRVEKYKKNPDPYTLLLSGSVGFLFFSGTYYVFFDRLSTILYAITIPFDMMISWGENWIRKREFETEQFFQNQYLLLPDVPSGPAERSEIAPKNTHKA